MANEDLTELHFFGIPTAFFEIFPKGLPVVIRTVVGTASFCFSHPIVADLPLRRISDNEFDLLLRADSFLDFVTLYDLAWTLMQMEEARFPITIHQVRESQSVLGVDGQPRVRVVSTTITAPYETQDTTVRPTKATTSLVEQEFEVEIG